VICDKINVFLLCAWSVFNTNANHCIVLLASFCCVARTLDLGFGIIFAKLQNNVQLILHLIRKIYYIHRRCFISVFIQAFAPLIIGAWESIYLLLDVFRRTDMHFSIWFNSLCSRLIRSTCSAIRYRPWLKWKIGAGGTIGSGLAPVCGRGPRCCSHGPPWPIVFVVT